jgi:hypothetical protein
MTNQKTNPQTLGLLEILRKIETRPGMYLGIPSVEQLFVFLAGYKTARRELGIELTAQEEDFSSEFQPWLQQKYQVQTVTSWAHIILSHSKDEAEAFRLFFKLLNEFSGRDKALADSSAELDLEVAR